MQYRQAGTDGPQLSVIGLGTWAIGGGDWKFGWGDQDESAALGAISAAVEQGINWIDTAAIYGEGRSEELVGRAVRELPLADRPLLATKCGRIALGNGEIGQSLRRDSVIAECEASLRRLQVEQIDLYQMHWPQPDEEIEEGWQTLVDLKAQGKVRWIGVSNHSVSQMQRLEQIQKIQTLQPPYSMIARECEEEILAYCGGRGTGVICYSPMGKGLLTGAFTKQRAESLTEKDHRSRDPRFQSPQLEINLEFVAELQRIADGLGWSMTDLAIAWTLRRPELTSAIVGARSPEQIRQTAAAGDRNMGVAAETAVEAALTQRLERLDTVGGAARPRV